MTRAEDPNVHITSHYKDGSYILTVTYATMHYDGRHTVTVRADYHDWADVDMAHTELSGLSMWTTDLASPPDEGPVAIEFKLVLDGKYWMAGPNQRATTGRPAAIA